MAWKMSPPSCPRCGTLMTEMGERKAAFSGGKALVGGLLAGPMGLAAGALGKNVHMYQCKSCGYTKEV